MGTGKQYDEEFKKQAIKLAKEIVHLALCRWVYFYLYCVLFYSSPALI